MSKEWFSAAELAGLPCLPGTPQNITARATREQWLSRPRAGCGGGKEYAIRSLPAETQAALFKKYVPVLPSAPDSPGAVPPHGALPTGAEAFTYDADELGRWAMSRSQRLRDQGARRAEMLRCALRLTYTSHCTLKRAFEIVAGQYDESVANLRNWYYGLNGQPGARQYQRADWAFALIPSYAGGIACAEIHNTAWQWFTSYYLTRRKPTLSEACRRLAEIATEQQWGPMPSRDTFARRLRRDVPLPVSVYLREGPEALAKLFPTQRRDKTVYAAGEAVTGDGLKFDKLYVRWPDGEILNTSTGWFWADLRTGKMLAYRLAKTENTDLFRLATYDLTAICAPKYAWVDNTVVAANKAMTGRAEGRHRFHDRTDDPIGLLLQCGIDVHFTNPSEEMGNPGAKPIERAFGIGGIHDKVATHPAIINRGYSTATAIDYDEFAQIVANEVKRFNAQTCRRSIVCRGVLSFDQAFDESFSQSTVRKLSDAQRNLLLLMPEVVRADAVRGEIKIKAGRGPHGQHRFWCETLGRYQSRQLVVYYDPEQLNQPIAVYTLDGKFITKADHLGDVAFNSKTDGAQWNKHKARYIKLNKKMGKESRQMSDLEIAALYPQSEDIVVADPGVVQGVFTMKRKVVDGVVTDRGAPNAQHERDFANQVASMVQKLKDDII